MMRKMITLVYIVHELIYIVYEKRQKTTIQFLEKRFSGRDGARQNSIIDRDNCNDPDSLWRGRETERGNIPINAR